eukprot:jgi/Chrzof1/11164/Cz05g26090.t1
MNNNKSDEAAVLAGCKGVFSKTSYITIGAEGKPLDYGTKVEQLRPCYKGKQFATVAPHDGKTLDTYFEKKHNWIADGDKYVDKWRYIDIQKDKKKGFGTSDFSKRDEFTNTVRTLQWREQLSHEAKWTKQAIDFFNQAAEQSGSFTQTNAPISHPEDEPALYDLVNEKFDYSAPAASYTHRDTKNRTMLSHERNLGGMMTSSKLAFQPPADFSKPEFARKPLIRDTFYRKTNPFFPAACDSTTAQ